MNRQNPARGPAKSDQDADLRRQINQVDEEQFQHAVQTEVFRRLSAFCKGIETYQTSIRQQRPAAPPVLAEFAGARLLDYAAPGDPSHKTPVLVIPSLINRAYILDLTPQRSLMQYLASRGLRPLLVDWGQPGKTEADYDLQAYITGPLQHFIDVASQLSSRQPSIVGYCMGGLLALALALRNPQQTTSLALLATPWNFQSQMDANLIALQSLRPGLEMLIDHIGNLPVDILQALFSSLNPSLTGEKFRQFALLNKTDDRAQHFIALEDWLNDGVPLVASVARECLFGWYLENTPYKGQWTIEGSPVLPEELHCPSLTAIPTNDHIVPPASAQALADVLPRNQPLYLQTGHIGMITGSHAKSALYEPLGKWIESHYTE